MTFSSSSSKTEWNNFVIENSPPIGNFMQTWEWGSFKEACGEKIQRFIITDDSRTLAIFTLIEHKIIFGCSYGYVPRGPLFAKAVQLDEKRILEILNEIKNWVKKSFPQLLFVRLEPSIISLEKDSKKGFFFPSYYIQPRYNHAVSVNRSEEELIKSFHPSVRSNIHRAEKRGVTVELKDHLKAECYNEFIFLGQDTIKRNSGKNVYPGENYFSSLFKSVPSVLNELNQNNLSIGAFYGYQHGDLAAIHFVLFFGKTATYLYGASSTTHLSSKVTTYLHWSAMREAGKRGMEYYDLGGIDEKLWPSLTSFKRQFRGKEFSYIGNIDIPQKLLFYRFYEIIQGIRKRF